MSNIVYVITQGCYSDYHICAVTMDVDRARRLQKLFSDHYGNIANIEEFPLDEIQPEHVYGVTFSICTHQLAHVKRDEYVWHSSGLIEEDYETVTIWVAAKNEDSAIKAAQDRYAQYRAEQEGIA